MAKPEDPSNRASADSAPLLDRPSTHQAIFWGLVVVCALLGVSDFLYHKHAHFSFETFPAFHGFFGFLAYLTIVNSAKLLRRLVGRPEDYYDR